MNRKHALLALKAVLTPAAGFCVRHGLKIQDAQEALKIVLIEVARAQLTSDRVEPNSSRLSATTGIPRKYVPNYSSDRIFEKTPGDILTRVLGQWQSDFRFRDARRRARPLDVSGAESEFNTLVRTVSADLNSYTVLNELLRLGYIERHEDRVHLSARINIVENFPEAMLLAAKDSEALQRAAEENILAERAEHLHLSTCYDNIPESVLPVVQRWMLKEGSAFHRRARLMFSKVDRDVAPSAGAPGDRRHRMHLGAFSFTEPFTGANECGLEMRSGKSRTGKSGGEA